MPIVIASWMPETSPPRQRAGAVSPTCSGATVVAAPTASPSTSRHPSSRSSRQALAAPGAASRNSAAVAISTGRRPQRRAAAPARMDPTSPPSSTEETTMPCIASLSPNRAVRKPSAGAITAVS